MLTLLLALSAAQPLVRVPPEKSPIEQYYVPPRFRWSRSDGRYTPGDAPPSDVSYAFFEAFPLSGAGTTSACSTTAPTGAKGETLTFTRTGNATCSKKGLATTGIADGDLVVMSGNVARVEPDADGVLGLRVEGSRQNVIVRSEEIDNASWVNSATGGAAAPTLNGANAAVAPDGTLTAEDYTFAATTGAQTSARAQVSCPSSGIASIYVKGVSGSGSLDVCSNTAHCATCNYVSTSWTRCVSLQNTTGNYYVGNMTQFNGGIARASNRVYIWGAQCEAGAYATSYIPTVAAAATRNAETAYFDLGSALTVGSTAANYWIPSVGMLAAAPHSPTTAGDTTTSPALGVIANAGYMKAFAIAGGGYSALGRAEASGRVAASLNSTSSPTKATAWWDSSTSDTTGSGTSKTTSRYQYVGSFDGVGDKLNGIASRVCRDPDPERCR